jgi:hypothetical protein
MTKSTLLSFLTVLLLAVHLQAANFTSAKAGNWQSATTWTITSGVDADGIPSVGDNVTITHAVVLDISPTIATLSIQNGNLTGGHSLVITGNLTLNGGTLANDASISVGGTFTWTLGTIGSSSAAFVVDMMIAGTTYFNTSSSNLIKKRLLLNGGAIWTSGYLTMSEGGTLETAYGQDFVFNSALETGFTGISGGTFQIYGRFLKQGTNNFPLSTQFNNNGIVQIDGGTLTINSYAGTGSMAVASGATLSIASIGDMYYPYTSFTNNGTITGGLLHFNSTFQQNLLGNGTITNLTIDNPQGLVVLGTQTITNLSLANGKLLLTNNDLTVLGDIGAVNASRYIQTNGLGNLKRTVGTTNTLFPIGESNYTPVTISQASGTDVYAARVSDGLDNSHPLKTTSYVKKEWNITRTPSNTTAATIKTEWNAPTDEGVGFIAAAARLLHFNGASWTILPSSGTTTTANSLTQTGVVSFPVFGVGLPVAVLPLELTDFKVTTKASKQTPHAFGLINQYNFEKTALLTWTTASEQNTAHFDIERSNNGKTFEKIGETKAKGVSSTYQFTDSDPLPMVSGQVSTIGYYRLKMVDNDGSFTYSKVVSIAFDKDLTVKTFPNPVSNDLSIDVFSEAKYLDIDVIDVLGRSIYQKKEQNTDLSSGRHEGSKFLTINTLDWLSGIYLLKVSDGKTVFQQKIVKR